MPPKSGAQKPISGMPLDTFALIEWLDEKVYPIRMPEKTEWGTDAGRLKYAQLIGQRELIEMLKANARKKGG